MGNKQKAYIGIDPDCDKSGFALAVAGKIEQLECLDLFDLMIKLNELSDKYEISVRLESGWLLAKSNFSNRNVSGSRSANERIAKNVGANHEIGRQIEKYLKRMGISYTLVEPAGYSSYTHERFCNISSWPKSSRTNSEKRVAAMLVLGLGSKGTVNRKDL